MAEASSENMALSTLRTLGTRWPSGNPWDSGLTSVWGHAKGCPPVTVTRGERGPSRSRGSWGEGPQTPAPGGGDTPAGATSSTRGFSTHPLVSETVRPSRGRSCRQRAAELTWLSQQGREHQPVSKVDGSSSHFIS